jgi:class 3 adenylate cyclase
MNERRRTTIAAILAVVGFIASGVAIYFHDPAPDPDLEAVEAALERFNAANERMVKSMFELREAVLDAKEAQKELNEAKGD